MIIDEEVKAVTLAVVVVIGVFITAHEFLGNRIVEPYSELAVLGSNMMIGDYPEEVVAGDDFDLYLYVSNNEGKTMYYSVLIKFVDRSIPVNDATPIQVPIITKYDRILVSGANWTSPITLSLDECGSRKKLVFELWIYDESFDGLHYHGVFNQLLMNVTEPQIL